MPDRHSIPASPASTQCATSASHDSPAATSRRAPVRAMPRVATRTTVPGKPASATTTFEPPARTSDGSPAASRARTASTSSASVAASATAPAGPPRCSVVSSESSTAATLREEFARPRRRPAWMRTPALPPLPRPPARTLAAFAGVLVVITGGFLWLRDSSLVSVRKVTVTGVSGADAPRVRAALEQAARSMTTLHVRDGQLKTAVQPFPAVIGVTASSDFPHGIHIPVHEHVAVGVVAGAGSRLPVAADGTVLRGSTSQGLPLISTKSPPATERVTDPRTKALLQLLAAAPASMRAQAQRAFVGERGLTV